MKYCADLKSDKMKRHLKDVPTDVFYVIKWIFSSVVFFVVTIFKKGVV